MDNRDKARALVAFIYPSTKIPELIDMLAHDIKEKLDQLDAPEPKKWEPRGGEFYVDVDNRIETGGTTKGSRLAGREYPTREEAERAAHLHRCLDRLVNWMIEKHPKADIFDVCIGVSSEDNVFVNFYRTQGKTLRRLIDSGEVEL